VINTQDAFFVDCFFHCFQVINTLTSIVKCEQKEAVEYVTSIDRDGRSVVKCATFAACIKLKNEIEKKGMRITSVSKSQPLKVAIFHKNTVACQTFALQLLHWFQEFLGLNAKFRAVFCDIILTSPTSTNYSLRQILLYDIKLWKTARSAWHRLLICGMLMEYESKKELAINFTKVYTNIMQDFLRDDHYHSFSVVSLSVQLFTVPTVAHHLMAHESAFFKLMHTYYAECIEKYIKNRVLVFPKNAASTFNKRAHFIITDLRYLLTFKPEAWTQELRLGFLHGIQIVIRLLKSMQGMDAVTRQVGQHMEFEPEWESAFTLHIKLSHLITSIIEWCSTDKVILVKVYRMVLAALNENRFIVGLASNEVKELADHSANCLIYDVASKPVSIHLPLTRFLAGLYIHFEKFNLTFDNVSTTNDKPTPEEIIEPVLCTRTMISQVYSGMWRRNGYSLLNQLFFYRNVKCRNEMLDRDIVILQMGASLIESNEFLIHIMNKFNLLQWTEENYKPVLPSSEEDTLRQIINMVDEFLELLIIIVGERYVPGIGRISDDDRIKKEIIQQLCIKPLSHSELNKALNDEHGHGHENDIELVINDIAIFEKATSADKKGVYKLKDEFYHDYNMYFYHYTKEEKSKSEEMQRQRHKTKGELICCPPPKLPVLATPFSMIANLLQSDVMLLIMQTVLKQAIDLTCQTFAEGHLQKVSHS
jgi:E3 ubiquitin-protein ligase UBR2